MSRGSSGWIGWWVAVVAALLLGAVRRLGARGSWTIKVRKSQVRKHRTHRKHADKLGRCRPKHRR